MRKITIMAALLAAVVLGASAEAQTNGRSIGIMERSPGAKHRLTIISAYSCPYCRVLDTKGMDEIRRTWIPRGLEVETIPFVLSPTDISATIAATCGPMAGYARRATILFRAQPDILGNWNGADYNQKNKASSRQRGTGAPEIARLSGLITLAPSLGLTKQQLSKCLNDPEQQRRPGDRVRDADARWHIVGTPTVLLDGKRIGSTWEDVRLQLKRTFGTRG